jgi:TonB family protein
MKIPRDPATLVLVTIPPWAFVFGLLAPFVQVKSVLGCLLLASYALIQPFQIFLWYRIDARRRDFHRGRLLNIGIVTISYLAIPYYLFRSRGLRGGLVALGLSSLLFLISSLLLALGAVVGFYVAQFLNAEPVPVVVGTNPINASQAPPGTTELDQQVALLLSSNVRYPPAAWRNSHQGTARVRVYIAKSGEISRAELVQSAGDTDLDVEAIAVWERLKAKGVRLQVPKELSLGRSEIAFELPVQFSLN